MHPNGEGSKVDNLQLNISFDPPADYSGIAKAATGHRAWAGRAATIEELQGLLPQAVEAVLAGRSAILDARISAPAKF